VSPALFRVLIVAVVLTAIVAAGALIHVGWNLI
jgi:hypothetical protein